MFSSTIDAANCIRSEFVLRGSCRTLAGDNYALKLFQHHKPPGMPSNPRYSIGLTNAWISTKRTRANALKALPHRAQVVVAPSFLCGDGCMNRSRKERAKISVVQQIERQTATSRSDLHSNPATPNPSEAPRPKY